MAKSKIHEREDTKDNEGIHKYGEVEFADSVNNKYPIDTPEHVRAAHRYINQEDNAAKYSAAEVKIIKDRIARAAKKYGIEIGEH